jgi:N-acyl-D-aspartate/D-glutamate deacylase
VRTGFKADLVVLDERRVRPAMPTVETDLPVRVSWPVAARPGADITPRV